MTDAPSTRSERRTRFLDRLQREPTPPVGVRSGGDSVYSRLFDATPPTVRDCVNDFDTAKLRRGVPGAPATRSNADASKLLQPIQSVLPLGPRVNTRRGPHC